MGRSQSSLLVQVRLAHPGIGQSFAIDILSTLSNAALLYRFSANPSRRHLARGPDSETFIRLDRCTGLRINSSFGRVDEPNSVYSLLILRLGHALEFLEVP